MAAEPQSRAVVEVQHPYSSMGGGKNNQVHDPEHVVGEFLEVLSHVCLDLTIHYS